MKRYKIRCHDCDPEIVQHDAGKWVRYTDVESLRAELELHKGALIAEQEHVETLEAELAACREDAERYRWLREHWDDVNHPVDFIICNSFVTTLDADVDAARKGEGE